MADDPRGVPDHDTGDEDGNRPVDDADALVVAESEPVSPPPLDVDQREGRDPEDDPIAMPDAESAERARRLRWNSSIDNLIPEPRDEPYHDDDEAGPDPYDARDDVDIHLPPATGDARDEVDDFSTGEELDVDNAPAGHNPEHRAPEANEVPATGESATYRFGRDAEDALPETREPVETQPSEDVEPHAVTRQLTTCPVCGQATEPLRFCGYCGSPLTEGRREIIGDTPVQRLVSRAEGLLEPVAEWTRPGAIRAILAVGFLLVLLSLLGNSGALALIFGASILPIAILYWCRKVDVVENEPWYIIVAFGIVGVVIGALLGWLAAFTTTTSWFESGVLNFGAAGFGGRFAEAAGAAPFIVWMIGGALVPLLALAAIVASPLLARRFAPLGNEVMDGLTVAAAMGGGFAIGTAAVFVAPMFGQPGPSISPSAWTLTTIGLTIVRPLIWTLAGGMIGAGAWRYLFTGKLTTAIAPVGLGVLGPLLFALLSLQLQPVGLWAEVLAGVLIAGVVAVLYARTLSEAIREDRKVLGADEARIVCPHCHRVTPQGQFCAHCGEEIPTAAAEA